MSTRLPSEVSGSNYTNSQQRDSNNFSPPTNNLINNNNQEKQRNLLNDNTSPVNVKSEKGSLIGMNQQGKKDKVKRGSKACTGCRKLKLKCKWSISELETGLASSSQASSSARCDRCQENGHVCNFAVSLRGLHGAKKIEALAAKSVEEEKERNKNELSPQFYSPNPVLVRHHQPQPQKYSLPQASTSQPHQNQNQHQQQQQPSYGFSPNHSTTLSRMPHPSSRNLMGGNMASPHSSTPGRSSISGDGSGNTPAFNPRMGSRQEVETTDVDDLTRISNPLRLLADASDHSQPLSSPGSSRALMSGRSFKIGPIKLPVKGPKVANKLPPVLLSEGIITNEEATSLFEIFFDKCREQIPFLDRTVHTPESTSLKCPFLFTCICTVAARYATRKELYAQCFHQAMLLSGSAIANSKKSVEIIQGYLILSHWHQPTIHAEEDRTYMFSGLAMRMCLELGLHCKMNLAGEGLSLEERERVIREVRMNERTYIQAVITDRSLSLQMGKPVSVGKDYIIRNLKSWCSVPNVMISDVTLCCTLALQGVLIHTLDLLYSDSQSLTGLNDYADYSSIMRGFLTQLEAWKSEWTFTLLSAGRNSTAGPVDASSLHLKMFSFYHAYFRLFILSFAVQHAHEREHLASDLAYYVFLCFESCSIIISIAGDFLLPSGTLMYGKDSTFVYITYAASFLLKLVNPVFSHLVNAAEAISLSQQASQILAQSAMDENHTPCLYSIFLNNLIEMKLGRSGGGSVPSPGEEMAGGLNENGHEMDNKVDDQMNGNGLELGDQPIDAAIGEGGAGDGISMGEYRSISAELGGEKGMSAAGNEIDESMSNFWDNMLMPGYNGLPQFDAWGIGTRTPTESFDFFAPS